MHVIVGQEAWGNLRPNFLTPELGLAGPPMFYIILVSFVFCIDATPFLGRP